MNIYKKEQVYGEHPLILLAESITYHTEITVIRIFDLINIFHTYTHVVLLSCISKPAL